MAYLNQIKSRGQQTLRKRRNERAFLFDPQFMRCMGVAERGRWETAISFSGGNVAEAAEECGLMDIPKGAKVLWGRSAEDALVTYRRWQKRRKK